MEGYTVKQLATAAANLVEKGYGDKVVLISSDDEQNEFHTLYQMFATDPKLLRAMSEYGMFCDRNNPKDVVLLG